ncbi:MAG: 30S ribosomal protein S12 methylthiotransferase RimO [Bacteroidales bacterium]|jgi:ribosomal protein S12 methylthiotransferase|nr:30S ribosomal protein S12 methylthiotransferase RimO [Bacteroidales bacterium]
MTRKRKSIQVVTMGCSKNRVDTEHLLSQVSDVYDVVPEEAMVHVDILLVNTCGFIADAKEESVQAILTAAERKKNGEADKLIVFGCLSQRYREQLPGLIPEVDDWFGARDLSLLARSLGGKPAASRPLRFLFERQEPFAYLKVSEGCDRQCSYCAIPLIRGPHISVPMEELIREAGELAAAGVRELILIAQDTTFYGLDLYQRRALAELIRKLSAIEGIEWIRIHYSYPADFPEDLLEEMASNPKVCKYLDIPIQHISDPVLSCMRRGLDGARTRELIRKLRENVPGVVLRTTLIVGHPGEGRKEFQELLDFVGETRFERLGAFEYSVEEGTFGAEHFRDSVPRKEKKRRLSELMQRQQEISLAFNQSRVGSVARVLVDDWVDGVYVCRSQYESPEVDGEILVHALPEDFSCRRPEDLRGNFINVKITGADAYDLLAVPIQSSRS